MKNKLLILFCGVLIVLFGVYLRSNVEKVSGAILIICGVLIEFYAIYNLIKTFILKRNN